MAKALESNKNKKNVFVYGTLMKGQSRDNVLMGLAYELAILKGYDRIWPANTFPIIIKRKGQSVQGEIYFNIDHELLARLDSIEGEGHLYHRIEVEVELQGTNKTVRAFTYYPSQDLIAEYLGY